MATNIQKVRSLEEIPLGDSSSRVLGVGISYPFGFSSTGKAETIGVATGVAKVNQAIHMLLSTRYGERLMFPEYGSKLPELVFEQNDEILHAQLQLFTAEAVNRWEKRITLTGITTIDEDDQNAISIKIDYIINKLHVAGSYVYPFQLGALPLGLSAQYGGTL